MAQPRYQSREPTGGATLAGEIDLDPALSLAWVDGLLLNPPAAMTVSEFVEAAAWRTGLASAAPAGNKGTRPSFPTRARTLLEAACRDATQRTPAWADAQARDAPASANDYAARTKADALRRLPDELWDALFAPTNIAGTTAQGAQLLDSLLQSLPLTWRVKLQGGAWELYDANASARRHAFGKAAKLSYPPRMKLRIRGVRLGWIPAGGQLSGGAVRIPTPGANTVGEAVRIARANTMKLIPRTAYSALPVRGLLGSNAVGLALTFGPQAYADARSSGVLSNPADQESWKRFGLASARNQSANLAGVVAGVAAGAALAWFGVTAAPVLIVVGMAAGAIGQAGFNAVGLNEGAEEAARRLFSW